MINITRTPSFTTSDGKLHTDRALAVAHEKTVQRTARLTSFAQADGAIFTEGDYEWMVRNADQLIDILTVKQQRAPRAAKVTAPGAIVKIAGPVTGAGTITG